MFLVGKKLYVLAMITFSFSVLKNCLSSFVKPEIV